MRLPPGLPDLLSSPPPPPLLFSSFFLPVSPAILIELVAGITPTSLPGRSCRLVSISDVPFLVVVEEEEDEEGMQATSLPDDKDEEAKEEDEDEDEDEFLFFVCDPESLFPLPFVELAPPPIPVDAGFS